MDVFYGTNLLENLKIVEKSIYCTCFDTPTFENLNKFLAYFSLTFLFYSSSAQFFYFLNLLNSFSCIYSTTYSDTYCTFLQCHLKNVFLHDVEKFELNLLISITFHGNPEWVTIKKK